MTLQDYSGRTNTKLVFIKNCLTVTCEQSLELWWERKGRNKQWEKKVRSSQAQSTSISLVGDIKQTVVHWTITTPLLHGLCTGWLRLIYQSKIFSYNCSSKAILNNLCWVHKFMLPPMPRIQSRKNS